MIRTKETQRALEHTSEWIKVLMQDYSFASENKAFVVLRATLKSLRDRLSRQEVTHLGTLLPVLLRGFYYEGWDPEHTPTRFKDAYDFITLVRLHLNGHDDINLDEAVPVTLKLIFDLIEQKESEVLKEQLPYEVRDILS